LQRRRASPPPIGRDRLLLDTLFSYLGRILFLAVRSEGESPDPLLARVEVKGWK